MATAIPQPMGYLPCLAAQPRAVTAPRRRRDSTGFHAYLFTFTWALLSPIRWHDVLQGLTCSRTP